MVPSAAWSQCTSSCRQEPFCPLSFPAPLHFLPPTSGPLCFVARNNLLLPSCSEVTFCPWLDSTRLYQGIAFELAVAFLCRLIRCQGEQCKALQNSSVAQAWWKRWGWGVWGLYKADQWILVAKFLFCSKLKNKWYILKFIWTWLTHFCLITMPFREIGDYFRISVYSI